MLKNPYHVERLLIVVRTYPMPAKSGVEVSCTAAVTKSGQWMRLFPVPYRFLSDDKRFRKYQWIDVEVKKASDARPESYNPRSDSIVIVSEPLSTANEWRARKEWIVPLQSHCLCCLKRARDENNHPTLGFFKPLKIERLLIIPDSAEWTQGQREILSQTQLFAQGPDVELKKVPFTFKYIFRCDDELCTGHELSCTDWELGESWRRWSDRYGSGWEAKFRETYETKMIEENNTHFFVGTIHQHPGSWIIVGLFYPPHSPQADLFKNYPSESSQPS